MNLNTLKWQKYFGIFAISTNFIMLAGYAFFARPVQDDYVTLEQLSKGNVLTPSDELINHWGGNVVSVLIRSILLLPAQFGNNFIGLSFFVFLTFALLSAATYCFIKLVYGISLSFFQTLLASSLLSLAFEGLFSPTSLGVYAFSAASIVHFWPLCVFTIATYQLMRKSQLIAGLLFFLGANSNLTEGFLAVCILIVLKYMGKINVKKFLLALVFSIIGLLTIFLVPGFTERSDLFTPESSVVTIFIVILKNALVISADLFSHPGGYFILLLGLLAPGQLKIKSNSSATKFILEVFILYLVGSSLGASLAYLAWHQTLGLLLVWYGLTFQIGVSLGSHFEKKNRPMNKVILCLFLTALCVLNLRPVILVVDRAHLWDRNYAKEFCAELEEGFKSAEIIYPPADLGIEDIDKWEWMEQSFSYWVSQSNESSNICS